MRSQYILMAAGLLLYAAACNRSGNTASLSQSPAAKDIQAENTTSHVSAALYSDSTAQAADDNADKQTPSSTARQNGPGKPASATPPANPDWDKKIVKTGSVKIETNDFRHFDDRLHRSIAQYGGYIAQEEQVKSDYQIMNTVSLRVPVAAFDALVRELAADSDRMVEKRIQSEDVTMQLVDTRSRLETKRELRLKYLEMLRQAGKMDDILRLQQEINEIQEQMDAAAGRISFLSHSAAFSTINLVYYQVLAPGAPTEKDPGFFHELGQSFANCWKWVRELMLGLISVWPLLLLIPAGLIGIRRWTKRIPAKPAA